MVRPIQSAHVLWLVVTFLCASLAAEVNGQEVNGQDAQAAEQPQVDGANVDAVVQKVADFYQEVKTLQVKVAIAHVMESEVIQQKHELVYEIQIKPPARYAYRVVQGDSGATVVSDGQQILTYLPPLNQYTREAAPEDDPESFATAGMAMIGLVQPPLLVATPHPQFTEQLMEGVQQTQYLGKQDIDGIACHHLHFTQEQFDWELWVQAEGRPLPRRMVMDMSKAFAQVEADDALAGALAGAKMHLTATYKDWKVDEPIADEVFVFSPPEGAQEVDSFFAEALPSDEGLHSLLGKPAPEFTLGQLEGDEVELKQHLGDVVVLDFWATWCPPCVAALPKLEQVTSQLRDQGVVFYAINLAEDAETVKTFLTDRELNIDVLMDADASVADAYGVESIPQTVLIGKDGTVQVVHVGLSGDLETALAQQLRALIEGKDLASEQIKEAAEQTAVELEVKNLQQVWAVDQAAVAVACDDVSQTVFAADMTGRCWKIDYQGNQQESVQLADDPSVLRTANLIPGEATQLLSFSGWGPTVKALNTGGAALWTYELGQGVNDVWAYDLDGDGLSEVVIGYNGATGLHVLDHEGKPIWKNTQLGNVWNVSAGVVRANEPPVVVSTSAQGMVHVFSADGNRIDNLRASCYATMIRIADGESLTKPQIIVGGTGDRGEVLLGMDAEGQEHWKVTLAGRGGHIDSALVATGAPWIALGMRGGAVHVVDVEQGTVIATASGQGHAPQVAWLRPDLQAPPLLLVASGRQLTAFRIVDDAQAESARSVNGVAVKRAGSVASVAISLLALHGSAGCLRKPDPERSTRDTSCQSRDPVGRSGQNPARSTTERACPGAAGCSRLVSPDGSVPPLVSRPSLPIRSAGRRDPYQT